MSQQAQITSVDAVENFRALLVVYLGKARATLDEVRDEIGRTRQWVEHDQQRLWDHEARHRGRQLERLRGELFNARLSPIHGDATLQQMAVQKAQRAMEEAEGKLVMLRKWDRELENLTDPLLKPVGQLQGFLATDMNKAVAYLAQSIQALEAYTDVAAPNLAVTPATASGDETKASS